MLAFVMAGDFDTVSQIRKTVKESGLDHKKKFTIGVYVGKELIATGEGE